MDTPAEGQTEQRIADIERECKLYDMLLDGDDVRWLLAELRAARKQLEPRADSLLLQVPTKDGLIVFTDDMREAARATAGLLGDATPLGAICAGAIAVIDAAPRLVPSPRPTPSFLSDQERDSIDTVLVPLIGKYGVERVSATVRALATGERQVAS